MLMRCSTSSALDRLEAFHAGKLHEQYPEMARAIMDMPAAWKEERLGRPYPKLEGDDQLFYAVIRRKKDRSQEWFLDLHAALSVLAVIATGKIIPISLNHKDYTLHGNGLSFCREELDPFDVGLMGIRAVTNFYSAFWRRARVMQQHGMWVDKSPIGVSIMPGNEHCGGVGKYAMMPIQYTGANDKTTSPEWHEWMKRWGHLAVID